MQVKAILRDDVIRDALCIVVYLTSAREMSSKTAMKSV